MPYHYRPVDREQSSPSPCVPCNCSAGPGTAVGQQAGDCLMNSDTADAVPGMVCSGRYTYDGA